jgi:hypothetical protein
MSAPTPISDWLEKLGLGQYAQQFVENETTPSILPDLSDANLKELGVSALGHRRLLLRAITEISGLEKGALKPAASAAGPVATHDTAERRQVTVMFSDLVGSTGALSAYRPGGSTSGHFRVSEVRRRDRAALWWLRCKVAYRRTSITSSASPVHSRQGSSR